MLVNLSDQDKAGVLVSTIVARCSVNGLQEFFNIVAKRNGWEIKYDIITKDVYDILDDMKNAVPQIKSYKDKNIKLPISILNDLQTAIVNDSKFFMESLESNNIPKEAFDAFRLFVETAPKLYTLWATNLTWTNDVDCEASLPL